MGDLQNIVDKNDVNISNLHYVTISTPKRFLYQSTWYMYTSIQIWTGGLNNSFGVHVGLFTNIIDHVLEIMQFPDKDRPVVYGTNEIIKLKNYNVKTIIGQLVRCLKCDSCSEILSL